MKSPEEAGLGQRSQQPDPNPEEEQDFKDLGFGTKIDVNQRRLINKDGSFNVIRTGGGIGAINPYLYLISISWKKFFLVTLLAYILVNAIFASIYLSLGVENLTLAPKPVEGSLTNFFNQFGYAFYFSAQTFTTVGYGAISPTGHPTQLGASLEALCGLMGFALVTGVLFGRFSKPSAKINFSEKAIIAPYQDINGFMFRIVNRRKNQLIELEVQVVMMVFVSENGEIKQQYHLLDLERRRVTLFPLSWTIVHPITEASPLYGETEASLKAKHAEFLIVIKAFDDTFAQNVHARNSYKHHELNWGARFVKVFHSDDEGNMRIEVDKISLCERAELNQY